MSIQDFVHETSGWMCDEGPHSDIVISTRIRLARNLIEHPFPMLASEHQADDIIERVRDAIETESFAEAGGGRFEMIHLDDISELDLHTLEEKYLISSTLVDHATRGAVAIREDELVSIMINEEDHLRLQVLMPGLQLGEAWATANRIDDLLEARLNYAFDERYGYLTACPTNVGTGIRASIMLHLPALVATGQINRVLSALGQVGLVVRGIHGEGTEAVGNLFQLSNQITLGQPEEEVIQSLESVAQKMIEHEIQARNYLLQESREDIEDRVARSFGILAYARRLSAKETMQRLSDLRLGIDLGVIKGISKNILKELMVMSQPAFLQKKSGVSLAPNERDWRRAELVRDKLQSEAGHI
ncbi:protein arginine kinase [Tumebacillus algifaecis]|uniref:Protein-arginine kinase n=1 Tax=Tumebacillus algifaecis TaxID=1214604 RepID=A0A223D5Y1_9BACL|nr:protein arginine kinase [Tumebacillus algifaecis]ASS76955.1 protein arginine kinase [Tumebacillus algifaecis]